MPGEEFHADRFAVNQYMKNKTLNFTAAALCLFASLSVKAQIPETFIGQKSSDSKTEVLERIIFLEPGEQCGKVEISDSCLVLLTDFQMSINIPLGKTYKTVLPAGTKFFVPKGTYNLENLTNQSLSFQLYESVDCADIQSNLK